MSCYLRPMKKRPFPYQYNRPKTYAHRPKELRSKDATLRTKRKIPEDNHSQKQEGSASVVEHVRQPRESSHGVRAWGRLFGAICTYMNTPISLPRATTPTGRPTDRAHPSGARGMHPRAFLFSVDSETELDLHTACKRRRVEESSTRWAGRRGYCSDVHLSAPG